MRDAVVTNLATQLDLFHFVLEDDDGGVCDRCRREAADLAQPHPQALVWWCGSCRELATACQCCDEEIPTKDLFCEECVGPFDDFPDHFGDER